MGKLQLLGVCSHACKIRMVTLAYGGHCRLLTQSHPTVCGLPPQHCQAHTLPLSFTYTFIVHQSLSLTLEAPNIRALVSQPSFSQIKFWWSSSGPSNWGKCHNIFWERLPTPPTKYIHGQKHWLLCWVWSFASVRSAIVSVIRQWEREHCTEYGRMKRWTTWTFDNIITLQNFFIWNHTYGQCLNQFWLAILKLAVEMTIQFYIKWIRWMMCLARKQSIVVKSWDIEVRWSFF